jgi:putative oxidoreductase
MATKSFATSSTPTAHRATPSRALRITLWTVSVITAAMFVMSGGMKLAGAAMAVQLFDTIGVGQWFRYVTGAIELGGGLALLAPPVAAYGAAALVATMIGAILTHLVILGDSPAVPVVLLAASLFIGWTRWSRR